MATVLRGLMLVILLLALPGVALAQGVEVTAEAPGGVVVDNGPSPVDDTVTLPGWALTNLAVVFVAASALTTIVSAIMIRGSFSAALEQTSKANKDAIEAAYEALPDNARDLSERVLSVAENVLEEATAIFRFLREVTDGLPNREPPGE